MKRFWVLLLTAALWSGQSLAQSVVPFSDTDYLSKETENPVTRRVTLPLRYGQTSSTAQTILLSPSSNSTKQWCHSG